MAADLHVALLEHVQEADLDPLGEVGQLVDGEDAPVDPGDEAVVEGELVGEVAALGHLDRVDLADQVGDRGVRGGQLLAVAVRAVHPGDRRLVALVGHLQPGVAGGRVVGVVVDLRAGHDRHPLVEQVDERADDPGLRLAPLAQQDDVVPGQDGVLELGDDRVLEAEHPVDQRLAGGDPARRRCGGAPLRPGPTPSRRPGGPRASAAGRGAGREGGRAGAGHGPRAYGFSAVPPPHLVRRAIARPDREHRRTRIALASGAGDGKMRPILTG